MPYNFAADSFHKINFVANFFDRTTLLDEKRPLCVFSPLWG